MNVFNLQNWDSHDKFSMNIPLILNIFMMQRRWCCVSIPMNEFGIINVATTQRRRWYVGIPMDISTMINTLMVQLGTSCSFDSPGLARNEPTPGEHPQGDSTP